MTRKYLATIAVVIGSVVGSSVAFGDFTFRPPANTNPDDQTTCWGGGDDACISWETADADQNYLSIVTPSSSSANESGCVIIQADADVDRGLSCDDGAGNTRPELLVCSNDQSDVDECFFVHHNNARAVIGNKDPTQQMLVRANALFVGEGDKTEEDLHLSIASGTARLGVRTGTSYTGFAGNVINGSTTKDQWALELSDTFGNQLVVASGTAGQSLDYCHAEPTDPTIFIHSDTVPSTEPCEAPQWGSLSHNKADFVIASGTGDISPQPASGALVQKMAFWVSTEMSHDSSSPLTLFTLQAGDMILGAAVQVTETWNGSGVDIDVGPASDTDGIYDALDQTSDDLGSTGYKCEDWDSGGFGGTECAFKSGGILMSSGSKIKRYVASGSEIVKATFNNAGSGTSQGTAKVWLQIVRLN